MMNVIPIGRKSNGGRCHETDQVDTGHHMYYYEGSMHGLIGSILRALIFQDGSFVLQRIDECRDRSIIRPYDMIVSRQAFCVSIALV